MTTLPLFSRRQGARPRGLGRVIVAEDDAVLALALEDALLRGGAQAVELCSTMQAAMQALQRGGRTSSARPDALILDVHLADRGDGWALAELASLLGPRLPRIIFATATPQEIPAAVAALGQVLPKPYDPESVVAMLKAPRGRLLRGWRRARD